MIVDPDFLDHWRTQMLSDLLDGDQMAPVYVIRLWSHCQNRRDTRFSPMPPAGLKAICRFQGDAAQLETAMIQAGFVERDGDEISVPKWAEYNSQLMANWENGRRGGRPKKTHPKPNGNPSGTQPKPKSAESENGVTSLEPRREEKRREDIRPPYPPPSAGGDSEGQDADASSEDQPPAPERDVIADGFRQFWAAYPKRSGEDAARKAFTKAVGRAQQERGKGRAEAIQHLTDKAGEFAASPRGQGEFCPDASRWLSDGRWKDDPATWQVPQPATVIGSASDTGAREAWQQFRAAAKLWHPADRERSRRAIESLPPEVYGIVKSLGGFRHYNEAGDKAANQFMAEFMIAWNERSTAGVAP